MTRYLDGPTARSPETSPPEFDDPGMVDPQDLDDDNRRHWIAVADEAIKDELLLRLMGENDALRKSARLLDGQLSRVLHEMAGAVSLCWEPKPTGVFASTQACEFVANAITELRGLASSVKE